MYIFIYTFIIFAQNLYMLLFHEYLLLILFEILNLLSLMIHKNNIIICVFIKKYISKFLIL